MFPDIHQSFEQLHISLNNLDFSHNKTKKYTNIKSVFLHTIFYNSDMFR